MPSSSLVQELNSFEIPFPRFESQLTGLSGILSNGNVRYTFEPEHELELKFAESEGGLQGEFQSETGISLGHQNSELNLPELQDFNKVANHCSEKRKFW